MRTYLTRLTMTAAGVMLTGASLTGVAYANDGDGYVFVDPSILEELGNLEPCDEIAGSQDMLLPIDPNAVPDHEIQPTEPDDQPAGPPWGEFELVPCYQIPVEPEDDGDEPEDDGDEPDDDETNDGDEPDGGQEPGNGNTGGGQGGGNGGSNGQTGGAPSGNPDSGDGVGGEGFGDTADDETSEPDQQETVTPTAATAGDDNSSLLLAILAGVLGALGLFILVHGLRKRPRRGQQPA